jgi:hypothetical protein
MIKNLPLVILIFGFMSGIYAQDKIITISNDTIDCKINRVSPNAIYYVIIANNDKISGKMALRNVLSYNILNLSSEDISENANRNKEDRMRLGVSIGPGYLIGSTKEAVDQMVGQGFTTSQAKTYYNDMKLGTSVAADLYFLISPGYYCGVKYKFLYNYCNTEGFVDPQDNVNLYFTTYSEKIFVNFYGASIYYQKKAGSKKPLMLNSTVSVGLTTYRNEAGFLESYYLLTGKSPGGDFTIGFDYFIARRISIGTELSLFISSIRKMKISDGFSTSTIKLEKENFENLSRMDLLFGIRIFF